MDAKLTVTNICGAQCYTCPNWHEKERTMDYETFCKAWEILNDAPEIGRILVNNVGDINELPDSEKYLLKMEERKKPVIMTTNANSLQYVPKVDVIVISFNGGTKRTFEHSTGLSFEKVIENIRDAYPQLARIPYVELDCLIWQGNEGDEQAFIDLWKDFPGQLRIGYKVENQGGEYFGLEKYRDDNRIPCDYLDMLSIAPSGNVLSCAHDFSESTNWGNIFTDSMSFIVDHPERLKMKAYHRVDKYPGLCETCNYNCTIEGKFYYVKK